MKMTQWGVVLGVLVAVLLAPLGRAMGDVSYPPRPGPRDFISDGAKLLSASDAAAIKVTAEKLLAEKNVALVVATIDSMGAYGAGGWPVERYAMNLFDEWGLGSPEHNYGILLLVSKGDRKARIELGKAFNRERDEQATAIMQGAIVPRFKRGDFSGGIRAGVEQLDALARGARLGYAAPRNAAQTPGAAPAPPRSAPAVPSSSIPSPGIPNRLGALFGPLVCVGIGILAVIVLIVAGAMGRAGSRGAGRVAPGYGGFGGMSGYRRGGWGWGGYGSSMPPWWWWMGSGGLGGWGNSASSHRSGDSGHSSGSGFGGGGFGGGSFGGSSGGSFGGGFSGGGGATGSW
jgi:uncharacterized membrane protein YgcG